jgi:hypothetical protein
VTRRAKSQVAREWRFESSLRHLEAKGLVATSRKSFSLGVAEMGWEPVNPPSVTDRGLTAPLANVSSLARRPSGLPRPPFARRARVCEVIVRHHV